MKNFIFITAAIVISLGFIGLAITLKHNPGRQMEPGLGSYLLII